MISNFCYDVYTVFWRDWVVFKKIFFKFLCSRMITPFLYIFGFCLGDAGYGLLLLLGITIYKFKAKPAIKPILSLAQWLGISTVIMGIVGGTFFGIQLLDVQVPWMEKMKAYKW